MSLANPHMRFGCVQGGYYDRLAYKRTILEFQFRRNKKYSFSENATQAEENWRYQKLKKLNLFLITSKSYF